MASASHPALLGLGRIDWDDTGSLLHHARPLFDALTDQSGLLPALLDTLAADPHLQPMCEHYDFMDKLVLHDDRESQSRLRLHLYRPGYFDRPHNHRWSFASHILRGSYTHRIFGRDDQFGEDTDPDTLQPIHERVERAGSSYALHHTSVHSVHAEADSISLLLRGPAAKDRFLILDRSGPSFWAYGAAHESPQTRASKQMSRGQVEEAIARIRSLIATAHPAPSEV